jgi:hypothetical protein
MKYKSKKLSKHGPLKKPEVGSGVKELVPPVDRSHPLRAPFKAQDSLAKIGMCRSGKQNNPQSKSECQSSKRNN